MPSALVKAIRERHKLSDERWFTEIDGRPARVDVCVQCSDRWPCQTELAAREIERLEPKARLADALYEAMRSARTSRMALGDWYHQHVGCGFDDEDDGEAIAALKEATT